MKDSNKAVRNGDSVTLTYMGTEVTFEWPYKVLVVAQDADGEVWAFNSLEVEPTSILGGAWCHVNESNFTTNKCKHVSTCISGVGEWADSLVEYSL